MTHRFTRSTSTVLKPLLALMLVAHHLSYHIHSVWLVPFGHLGAPIVSIFLFVSSYGLRTRYAARGDDYLSAFFIRRIWKVLVPFLAVLVLYELFLGHPASFLTDVHNQLVYGIPVIPNAWFVEVIVLLYVFFYLAYRYMPGRWKTAAVWCLTLLYVAVAQALHYERCWWVSVLAFPAGLSYAALEDKLRPVPVLAASGLLALLLLFTRNDICWMGCYIFIPVIVVVLASYCRLDRLERPVVVLLSGFSYEIYLCHGIWIDVLRGTSVQRNAVLFVAAVYILTLLSAALLHAFLQSSGLLNPGQSESRSNR